MLASGPAQEEGLEVGTVTAHSLPSLPLPELELPLPELSELSEIGSILTELVDWLRVSKA